MAFSSSVEAIALFRDTVRQSFCSDGCLGPDGPLVFVGSNGTPNGNGDGAANGIAIDLASSQDLGLDGREYDFVFGSGAGGSKSPGRRNSGASSGKRGTDTAQAGGDAFVDLT